MFAGEIIEKARTVQLQWAEAHDQAARAAFERELAENGSANLNTTPPEFRPPPNPHRGQLLPAHLREALRRYKRDGEGGGVGFSGLSMGNLGVRGSVTWNAGGAGGRRIFR